MAEREKPPEDRAEADDRLKAGPTSKLKADRPTAGPAAAEIPPAEMLHPAARTASFDLERGCFCVAPVRVVGCGRSHRQDDQIGLRVARALAKDPPAHTHVRTSEAPGADLIADLDEVQLLVVVDAAARGAMPPGVWTRFAVAGHAGDHACELPELRAVSRAPAASGHTLGVATALELGRELAVLPPTVLVYLVAGSEFGYGEALSPAVASAIHPVADQISLDVQAWLHQHGFESE